MNFIILDLEWNASYSKKKGKYINEIIEFGAVKCDENLNIVSTFSSFVRLQVSKKIRTVVSELTSIKDENLVGAMPYMSVVSKFKRWCGDAIILTWGTSDILALIENCNYYTGSVKIPFLKSYANLQAYCESLLSSDSKDQLGLSTAAEILSIDASQIAHHRALDDSLLSLAIMKRLYPQNSISAFVETANAEFYKKITFKTSIISDIKHPLVTNKTMIFTCEKCSGEAKRLSKWQFRNKRFVADFHCPKCGYAFSGRIQLKEKYEGLVVNKKTISLPKIEKPREAKACDIANMKLTIATNGTGLLRFKEWENNNDINACFSTRIGGVSTGKFASINLGVNNGDDNRLVFENIERTCEAMSVYSNTLVAAHQDHNINIKRVNKNHGGTGVFREKFSKTFDGLCTDNKDVTLMIYASDCVPLYFFDSVKKCIGLAHAGWRGTANGMAKAMVEKLTAEFGSDPKDLIVAIGPSIGKNSFEVDPPCADEFLKLPEFEYYVDYTSQDKYNIDLWECNKRFLIRAGVKEENITIGGVCSMENSDLVFSHRVTKGQRGSNAAFLSLK
ncbi:MAG: peptidoglycan editing factor PgeF [Clostridia bacterium]